MGDWEAIAPWAWHFYLDGVNQLAVSLHLLMLFQARSTPICSHKAASLPAQQQ